jgi:YkoP-like protein
MSSVVGPAPVITRPLWTRLIFALDGCLQRRAGVFEYSDAHECIFRAQLSRLAGNVALADGSLGRAGDRVIDLHFWNEQIPLQTPGGNSLAWGCRFNRCFAKSLLELAQFLKNNSAFADVKIIRANVNLEMLDRIAKRHGFEPACNFGAPPAWKHLHEFGENILFWLLAIACNPDGRTQFWRHRKPLYLSRRTLDCEFAISARTDLPVPAGAIGSNCASNAPRARIPTQL